MNKLSEVILAPIAWINHAIMAICVFFWLVGRCMHLNMFFERKDDEEA